MDLFRPPNTDRKRIVDIRSYYELLELLTARSPSPPSSLRTETASFFSCFLTVVPSLSWSIDRFYICNVLELQKGRSPHRPGSAPRRHSRCSSRPAPCCGSRPPPQTRFGSGLRKKRRDSNFRPFSFGSSRFNVQMGAQNGATIQFKSDR